jgi:hypothetical protein
MAYQSWKIPGRNEQGHTMSIERADTRSPYVATLWEDGIPIARRPIADERARAIIAGLPAYLR